MIFTKLLYVHQLGPNFKNVTTSFAGDKKYVQWIPRLKLP